MPDELSVAPSGRAKCRGCGRKIAKGDLRFGESLPNPFGEGDATYWFHLACAGHMRPEKFAPALAESAAAIPERGALEEIARFGMSHRRLPRLLRAERAPSGRAHCRQCRDLIEKGAFRIALQMFEEGRMSPIGTIHLGCAEAYFGTRDIVACIARLSPELSQGDLHDIEGLLRDAPPAAEAEVRLAKTRPPVDPEERAAASGERASTKG